MWDMPDMTLDCIDMCDRASCHTNEYSMTNMNASWHTHE